MGTVVDKLNYLAATKDKFMQAMKMLGKDVDELTLREAVNLLYEDAIDRYADSLDVSTLPAYWEQSVKDGLRHTLTLGDGYVHHLVTTDNHYNANYRKSPSIMQVLQSTGLYGRVINLGDITDTHTQAQADNVLADYQPFLGNLLFAIGNHDDFNVGADSILYPLIKDDTTLQGSPETFNYYWDDAEHKIRYVVHNSPLYSQRSRFATTAGWIKGIPDGWSVIVLSHYAGMPFMSDFSGDATLTNHMDSVATDLRAFFMAFKEKHYVGWISGHEHTDALAADTLFAVVHQAVLNNDGHANDAVPWPKTAGTDSEQAVTIMSINPTTKDVQFYRIGKTTSYGRSWGYSYDISADSEHWIPNYWINGSNNFASGSSTTGKRALLWSSALPAVDANGNIIKYQIYSKSNAVPYWFYALSIKSDGTQTRLSDGSQSSHAYNFGAGWGSQSSRLPSNTQYIFACSEWNDANIDPDDIVLTSNPTLEDMSASLGVDYADAVWTEDKWISVSGTTSRITLANDAGTAAVLYILATPGAQYRLYVDDASFPTDKPFCQIYGLDRWRAIKTILYQQKDYGSALPITFTVPDDCGVICIGLGGAVGFTDKIRLENVT